MDSGGGKGGSEAHSPNFISFHLRTKEESFNIIVFFKTSMLLRIYSKISRRPSSPPPPNFFRETSPWSNFEFDIREQNVRTFWLNGLKQITIILRMLTQIFVNILKSTRGYDMICQVPCHWQRFREAILLFVKKNLLKPRKLTSRCCFLQYKWLSPWNQKIH